VKNPIAKRLDNKALRRRHCMPIDLPARSSYRSRAQSVADVFHVAQPREHHLTV